MIVQTLQDITTRTLSHSATQMIHCVQICQQTKNYQFSSDFKMFCCLLANRLGDDLQEEGIVGFRIPLDT